MPTVRDAKLSEAEFTTQVIAFARLHRWRVAHFRPGRTKDGGWRTAVQGDGAGYPDLVMLRGACLLVAELKVGKNKPTPAQLEWLEAWRAVGAEVHVWTPAHWPEIEAAIGGDRNQTQGAA